MRPLVVVLNDTHWADASSVDVVSRLLALADEAPLLFCLLTRPDDQTPGWRLVELARARAALELALAPLGQAESAALVANLLAIDALPDSTSELILARAEGNPFFVEEIVRMLIERGAIEQRDGRWVAVADIDPREIPGSLQGLLLARIDRLPEDAKRLAKVAAVIGREFELALLARVTRADATLPPLLARLEAAGLIHDGEGASHYAFRHALVQDAAYASLLKADRRELHAAVGTALEDVSPERADGLAATVATSTPA
ncbi:MAG: ATP-binding protein [Thermoleophilaceae bacterium]